MHSDVKGGRALPEQARILRVGHMIVCSEEIRTTINRMIGFDGVCVGKWILAACIKTCMLEEGYFAGICCGL